MEINGNNLDIDTVYKVSRGGVKVSLAKSARELMSQSRKFIESQVAKGEVIYGVNTGFGALSSVKISEKDITELQINLIRSHSVGIGPAFSKDETRAIMLLRANALARGHSGIRHEVVDKLLEFLNSDILPIIPSQGSVGASGDLAPLAHLALSLIGEGEVWGESDDFNKAVATSDQLKRKNISPLQLQSKEGLSLINGCQVMTAVGLLAAYRARELCRIADISGAMSIESLRGSRGPFDEQICNSRPHPGEKKTAANIRRILSNESEISKSHEDCDRVQDAYSLRCIPAVHGAVKDTLRKAIETLTIEANASTDNPLVFADTKSILSCGNFHGEPVAFQLDFLAIAIGALGNISQCRISRLVNPQFTSLPAFLAPNGGLNSGMMIVEVAAASLASENKIYSHPASADSIPTSVDKEDHVSMGTIAARKLKLVVENVSQILSMEILASMQALSLLKPLCPAGGVRAAYDFLAKDIPLATKDRVFSQDIKKIKSFVDDGRLVAHVEKSVGDLEW
jgi:histidine ammonia-lyase